MEVDQPQVVKVETFAGKIICCVSNTITDEELKKQIQEKMKTESKVNIFIRNDKYIRFGIYDSRYKLMEIKNKLNDPNNTLNWSLDVPLKEWVGCTFTGNTIIELDFSEIGLTGSLPSEIGNLINLTNLHCQYNQLTSLPSEIGNLVNLKYFYCSGNQLTALPSEIGNLVNLTEFYCNNNQLTELPSEIGNLVNLKKFYCGGNQLTSLPSEIGYLVNLINFNCSGNQLTSLPSEIGNIDNLQELWCYNNELVALPSEIGNLVNLKDLWCYNNQLTELPSEIVNLDLEYFDYTFNQITAL
jgi:Leucine-rich repeat (LRR) protein